jgi:hypothetical protein
MIRGLKARVKPCRRCAECLALRALRLLQAVAGLVLARVDRHLVQCRRRRYGLLLLLSRGGEKVRLVGLVLRQSRIDIDLVLSIRVAVL